MYWAIHQFPEFEHLDPTRRRQLLKRAAWRAYPTIIPLSVLGGFLVFVVTVPAALMLSAFSMIGPIVYLPMIVTILAAVVTVTAYLIQVNRLRRYIREAIADGFRGERLPFCFDCGYDLRALTAEQCPECGHPTGASAHQPGMT